MDIKTVAFFAAYCAVSGVKSCMDKVAEVAIMAILKSKLPH